MTGDAKRGRVAKPKPMIERACELAQSGDYAYLYQIERSLIKEGYPVAKGFEVSERIKLKAMLKHAKS